MIGHKIADKIIRASKSSKKSQNDNTNNVTEGPKERYISPEKRQQIIDELRLVQQYNIGISKNNKVGRQCTKSTIQV